MQDAEKDRYRSELYLEKGAELGEEFRRLSDWLEDIDVFLRSLSGLDARGFSDLRLMCDELGSNSIRHASPGKGVHLVVEIESTPGMVRLRLTDNGDEFNPFAQAVPYTGADLERRNVGGLGLYLISQLFPRAGYRRRDGLNIVEVEYYMGAHDRPRYTRVFNDPPRR